jgi:hypothetical protein
MEAEQEKVPKEQAAVKRVGGLRKRHRGGKLATERCQKPKDGSRRKLVAAHRGTTRRAKVAQRKRHGLKWQGKDKVASRTN